METVALNIWAEQREGGKLKRIQRDLVIHIWAENLNNGVIWIVLWIRISYKRIHHFCRIYPDPGELDPDPDASLFMAKNKFVQISENFPGFYSYTYIPFVNEETPPKKI